MAPSAADSRWNFVVSALKNKRKLSKLRHRLTGANFDAEITKDILAFVLAQEPIEIESIRVALQVGQWVGNAVGKGCSLHVANAVSRGCR